MARVLHLLSQRPGRSGSGVFLQAMVREAARCGHAQHVLAAGPPGTTAAELPPLGPDDFTLIPFPSPGAPFPVPGNSDVMPYLSTVFSRMTELMVEQYLEVSRAMMREARERFRPDIVHAHHLWLMTALAREVFDDVPVVATSHNAELRQMVKAPRLAPRVVPGIRALDRVCVLTPQSRQDTMDVYGVDESRIAETGAGYDGGLFHRSDQPRPVLLDRLRREFGVDLPDGPLVTFVGRLSTPKGVPFLLEAAARARAAGTAFHLVLVGATGSGEEGARVGELAREAGETVIHVGAQPPEAVALILQCSSLFALPSLFEGLPLTMLEAAACGCPCLLSALPTIRSWVPAGWVDAGHFRLVPALATTDADVPVPADVPRYVADLADAIASMLARPRTDADRADLASRLLPHSWAAVFARYESVYEDVLVAV
ncbi:glycosyltransferase family 4 protein [Longimicrobium sp.]|uniref:glycosyltransferase family 4 protein n=1 Tax=Longimicrobium sp. TaxID=2029185 RepID=UPI002E37BF79|nr:glycosyltransferase family 4 protein [Longimicrobium sp.]HEX6036825.1 glycosyltransferase family 4 protein [Longimicrobium sp.]